MPPKRKADKMYAGSDEKKAKPDEHYSCWCKWGEDCKSIRSQLLNCRDHPEYTFWTRNYIKVKVNKRSESNQKYIDVIRRHLGIEGTAKQYYIAPHHFPISMLKWQESLLSSENRHIKWGDPIPAKLANTLGLSTHKVDMHFKSTKADPKYCQVPNVSKDSL